MIGLQADGFSSIHICGIGSLLESYTLLFQVDQPPLVLVQITILYFGACGSVVG
jgi:hypothetical protein